MTHPHPSPVGQPLPGVPSPFTLPFYYASLANCDVYYLVDPAKVAPYLQGTGLSPAIFDGHALVGYDYQLYCGTFSAGLDVPPDQWPTGAGSFTQEVELNIVAYPTAQAHQVAEVTFEQYMQGDEQSKLLGNHRVFVPCDSENAIQAGEQLFGEPKFKTSLRSNLPSYNPVRAPTPDFKPAWVHTWGFRVDDPTDPTQDIFTTVVDLSNLALQPANPSPLTEYGTYNGKAIGCRWNLLQPMQLALLHGHESKRVTLHYGESSHPMQKAMKELIGDAPARAVRTFLSAPAAIQSRAYYL